MPGMQQVNVTVSGGQVSVDTPTLNLRGKGHVITIHWVMGTDGLRFTDTGIVIPENTGQFTGNQLQPNGQLYIWIDQNDDGRTYKYTVNVTNGTSTLSLDPIIVNGV